jgi:hypothetical protein
MSDIKTFFEGEVQFRRYSDTSTQGQQVVFALTDREALSSFIGKEGKRFACVLVEIGDDEQPVQQPERPKLGPLCREAIDLCVMTDFWRYVQAENEADAKEFILNVCGVSSRKDLDTVATAAEKFRALVRVPFIRWQRQQRSAA